MLLVVLAALVAWVLVAVGLGAVLGRVLASIRVDLEPAASLVTPVTSDAGWSTPVR